MRWTVPNILTILRLLAAPAVPLMFLYFQRPWADLAALALFLIAAVTDWFDGYLARALHQTSAFGAFLDPVADKLMVAAALILLVQLERVDAIIAVVIIGREITISALREWMARVGRSASVAVAYIGKLKTVAQMVAIPLLLYDAWAFGLDMRALGSVLIYIAAALTLWSMGYYLHRAVPLLTQQQSD